MSKTALSSVITLITIGMIVAAGFCVFDDAHDRSIQPDLCGSFLSTMIASTLAFSLVLATRTLPIFASAHLSVVLDLLTPPPRV